MFWVMGLAGRKAAAGESSRICWCIKTASGEASRSPTRRLLHSWSQLSRDQTSAQLAHMVVASRRLSFVYLFTADSSALWFSQMWIWEKRREGSEARWRTWSGPWRRPPAASSRSTRSALTTGASSCSTRRPPPSWSPAASWSPWRSSLGPLSSVTQARYTRIPIANTDDLLLTVWCVQASGGVEKDVLESYCWMYSTWSIPTKYKGVCSAHGVSHRGGKTRKSSCFGVCEALTSSGIFTWVRLLSFIPV